MVMTREKLISDLYDNTSTETGLYNLELNNEELTERDIQEATWLAQKGLVRGVMLVTGPPGAGKGLFGTVMAWKLRRYFKDRRILLDYKPKPLFDENAIEPYTLFNGDFMLEELNKMAKASGTESVSKEYSKEKISKVRELSEVWTNTQGAVLLKNAVLGLDELKRYFHNRRPMNTLGVLMGHIVTQWRHLDLLIIGMTPYKREIDAISFLPYVTHWVRCSWSMTRPDTTDAQVYRARFVGTTGIFEAVGKPITIHIDGGKAREELGGMRYYDTYNSKDIKNLKPTIKVRM